MPPLPRDLALRFLPLLLSLLIHVGLLAAVAGWVFRVPADPESHVAAAMQNGAAFADDDWELLEPVEVAPLVIEEPIPDAPLDPIADEALEIEELAPPTEPQEPGPGASAIPVDAPPRLRVRLPREQKAPPPQTPPPPPLVLGPSRDLAGNEPEIVEDAEPQFQPPPPYPRRAVSLRLEGTVVFLALVKADGSVEACEIESSSGHDILDAAARKALLTWRFKPRISGGLARPFTARVPFRFTIPDRSPDRVPDRG